MQTQKLQRKQDPRASDEMLSAVITAPQSVELKKIPVPRPGKDEVRIRLEGCGLCASNIPLWEGRKWFSYPVDPGSPGHEGWGLIDEVGENVHTLKPGDRVAALSYHAYSEYDITDKTHVVRLPETLNGQPFPGEPLGCAMNIFRRSGIQQGMKVAIVGSGFLGSLLIQLANNAGASVIALSRRHSSLCNAERFGADKIWTFNNSENLVDRVEEYTGGELCDCVIEATGKQEPLDLAARITAVRGRLVIAGYHQGKKRKVDMQLWNWRGIDVINAHERDPMKYVEGMKEAVNAVENEVLNPFPLFTHVFSKDQIQEAFNTLQQKPEGFTKALINFS